MDLKANRSTSRGTLGQNVRNDLRKNVFKEVSILFFKIQLCMRIMVCVPQVLLQPKASLSLCAVLSRGFHLLKLAGNCPMELSLRQKALFCMLESTLRVTLDSTGALQGVWKRISSQLTSPFMRKVSTNLGFRRNVHHLLSMETWILGKKTSWDSSTTGISQIKAPYNKSWPRLWLTNGEAYEDFKKTVREK